MKDHKHSSFMLVGNGEYSSTVLQQLDQSYASTPSEVATPVVRSGEECVANVLVSSNQNTASSLLSRDGDCCWTSASGEEPV